MSRVISKSVILLTSLRVLVTPLQTTHERPSRA